MRLDRLRGRRQVDRVLRLGKRRKGKHVHVVLLSNNERTNNDGTCVYAGVSVSRKLAKRAVDRNRMRRRCREALRLLVREIRNPPRMLCGAQLLLLPRPSSLTCDFEELKEELRSLLSL